MRHAICLTAYGVGSTRCALVIPFYCISQKLLLIFCLNFTAYYGVQKKFKMATKMRFIRKMLINVYYNSDLFPCEYLYRNGFSTGGKRCNM